MIIEVPKCACGTNMVPAPGDQAIFLCPNDDAIQATEYTDDNEGTGYRTPTVQDRRFNLAWTQRIREIYGPKAA